MPFSSGGKPRVPGRERTRQPTPPGRPAAHPFNHTVYAMTVFVAGGTGAVGARLVPALVGLGHDVVALARSPESAAAVEAMGARAAIADALDAAALTAAVREAAPQAVLHELTALADVTWNFKRLDEEFALTNRLRTEATDTLLAAARLAGARRFVAQSFCGWPFARVGGPVKTEDAPLDPSPPAAFAETLAAIRHLEERVSQAPDVEGVVLRYGNLYGAGTGFARDGAMARLVRTRQFPLVGGGAGVWSFVHVDDAVRATLAALSRGTPGIYNVVDDEPAPVSRWLPVLAEVAGAKPPQRVPAWLARFAIGTGGVTIMTDARGGANAKAKRELRWQPTYATWRDGFVECIGSRDTEPGGATGSEGGVAREALP